MQQRAIGEGENYGEMLECFILFTCIKLKLLQNFIYFKPFGEFRKSRPYRARKS